MLFLKLEGLMTIKSGSLIRIPGTLKLFNWSSVWVIPVLGSSDLIPESGNFKLLSIYFYIRKTYFLWINYLKHLHFILNYRATLRLHKNKNSLNKQKLINISSPYSIISFTIYNICELFHIFPSQIPI